MSPGPGPTLRTVTGRPVRRVRAGRPEASPVDDEVVVEEPLEIRVAGEPLVLTMRTPGRDSDLALGFLFAEGIIDSARDVGSAVHCGRPGDEGFDNTLDVVPGPGVSLDPDRLASSRRGTLTTAACGVCGRRSIADLLERTGPVPPGPEVSLERLVTSTERLAEVQPTFERTGAIHAAAALSGDGRIVESAEDVGRHNAVDKVLGALLRRGLVGAGQPGVSSADRPILLVVSGRISFEIVQKAAVAAIPVVSGVSAPTSLAVDLADRLGLTLAGFVRKGSLNLYTHPERVPEIGGD